MTSLLPSVQCNSFNLSKWGTQQCMIANVTHEFWEEVGLHHAWRWGRGTENRPFDQVLAGDNHQWLADVLSTDAVSGIHSVKVQSVTCCNAICGQLPSSVHSLCDSCTISIVNILMVMAYYSHCVAWVPL